MSNIQLMISVKLFSLYGLIYERREVFKLIKPQSTANFY